MELATRAKDELAAALKDSERRLAASDAAMESLRQDLAASERSRRDLQAERDELAEATNNKYGGSKGRRRVFVTCVANVNMMMILLCATRTAIVH